MYLHTLATLKSKTNKRQKKARYKEPQISKSVLLFTTYQFLRITTSTGVTNIGNNPYSPAGSSTGWLGKGLWLNKSTKFIPNPKVSFS